MKTIDLFINGVYESVLDEILKVQSHLPETIMFLQPYSSRAMVELRKDRPTVDDPMKLYMSTSTDLSTIKYSAEIVGWADKRGLQPDIRYAITRILVALQPDEGGLYAASPTKGESVNLLFIRRLRRISSIPVSDFNKVRGGKPVAEGRTTSGGWTYVKPKLS